MPIILAREQMISTLSEEEPHHAVDTDSEPEAQTEEVNELDLFADLGT